MKTCGILAGDGLAEVAPEMRSETAARSAVIGKGQRSRYVCNELTLRTAEPAAVEELTDKLRVVLRP
jgi:hypothetical protein